MPARPLLPKNVNTQPRCGQSAAQVEHTFPTSCLLGSSLKFISRTQLSPASGLGFFFGRSISRVHRANCVVAWCSQSSGTQVHSGSCAPRAWHFISCTRFLKEPSSSQRAATPASSLALSAGSAAIIAARPESIARWRAEKSALFSPTSDGRTTTSASLSS